MISRVFATGPTVELSRQVAELSQEITDRCAALFEAAQRGGPERAGLGARGAELQALQLELGRHLPAATGDDRTALLRVLGIQQQFLSLLDELQTARPPMPAPERSPPADIVTMCSVAGPQGETLWVAEPTSTARTGKSATSRPPRPETSAGARRAPQQPAVVRAPMPRSATPAPQVSTPPENVTSRLAAGLRGLSASTRHIGLGSQLIAAAAVIMGLVVTTASLIDPISLHLSGAPKQSETTVASRKPSERLSQSLAASGPAETIIEATAAGPSISAPGFVAILSSHATYAEARAAFVTMKQSYPGPLATTVPDIRTVKGLLGPERFELALLPALDKSEAEELCRRLRSLGHATCQVKPHP